jgi:hypothetical protein
MRKLEISESHHPPMKCDASIMPDTKKCKFTSRSKSECKSGNIQSASFEFQSYRKDSSFGGTGFDQPEIHRMQDKTLKIQLNFIYDV